MELKLADHHLEVAEDCLGLPAKTLVVSSINFPSPPPDSLMIVGGNNSSQQQRFQNQEVAPNSYFEHSFWADVDPNLIQFAKC